MNYTDIVTRLIFTHNYSLYIYNCSKMCQTETRIDNDPKFLSSRCAEEKSCVIVGV